VNDRIPYTYLIGWSDHNKFYYGLRHGIGCHPNELWKTYFTSSKYVKKFSQEYGDPDVIQIRKTFNCAKKARLWEHKVLRRINAKNKINFLNQTDNISISSEASKLGVETMKKMDVHPNKGIKKLHLTEMNKQKVGSLNHMWKIGENHPHYGKRAKDAPNYGKKQSEHQKQKASEKFACFYCNKLSNIGNLIRWHNDNCKQKTILKEK
jgi:hypothetical protein